MIRSGFLHLILVLGFLVTCSPPEPDDWALSPLAGRQLIVPRPPGVGVGGKTPREILVIVNPGKPKLLVYDPAQKATGFSRVHHGKGLDWFSPVTPMLDGWAVVTQPTGCFWFNYLTGKRGPVISNSIVGRDWTTPKVLDRQRGRICFLSGINVVMYDYLKGRGKVFAKARKSAEFDSGALVVEPWGEGDQRQIVRTDYLAEKMTQMGPLPGSGNDDHYSFLDCPPGICCLSDDTLWWREGRAAWSSLATGLTAVNCKYLVGRGRVRERDKWFHYLGNGRFAAKKIIKAPLTAWTFRPGGRVNGVNTWYQLIAGASGECLAKTEPTVEDRASLPTRWWPTDGSQGGGVKRPNPFRLNRKSRMVEFGRGGRIGPSENRFLTQSPTGRYLVLLPEFEGEEYHLLVLDSQTGQKHRLKLDFNPFGAKLHWCLLYGGNIGADDLVTEYDYHDYQNPDVGVFSDFPFHDLDIIGIHPSSRRTPEFKKRQHPALFKARFDSVVGDKTLAPVVDNALEWFARKQDQEGFWRETTTPKDLNAGDDRKAGQKRNLRETSLVTLAMQARGNTLRGGKYKAPLKAGIRWINRSVTDTLEVQALVTMALTEAFGLSHYRTLRRSLQNTLDLIGRRRQADSGWGKFKDSQVPDPTSTAYALLALTRNSHHEINP